MIHDFDSANKLTFLKILFIFCWQLIRNFTFMSISATYRIFRILNSKNSQKCYFILLFSILHLLAKIKDSSAHFIDLHSSEYAQKASMDETNLFKEIFLKNRIKCAKTNEEATFSMFLNPTVVKATAIRAFQIADTSSYSIAFQIKKIFKYENRVFSQESAYNEKNMKNFYKISSQDENSNEINPNSFVLVEYFNLNLLRDESCNNQIKVGSDYYLFLKSLDPSIRLEHRRYFTFPIALNALSLNYKIAYKNIDSKSFPFSKYSNDTFLTKMPIFEASFTPTLVTIDSKTESKIENLLCFLDAYCLANVEQDKIEEAKKSTNSHTSIN